MGGASLDRLGMPAAWQGSMPSGIEHIMGQATKYQTAVSGKEPGYSAEEMQDVVYLRGDSDGQCERCIVPTVYIFCLVIISKRRKNARRIIVGYGKNSQCSRSADISTTILAMRIRYRVRFTDHVNMMRLIMWMDLLAVPRR